MASAMVVWCRIIVIITSRTEGEEWEGEGPFMALLQTTVYDDDRGKKKKRINNWVSDEIRILRGGAGVWVGGWGAGVS